MPLFEDLCRSLARMIGVYTELLETAREQYSVFQQGNFAAILPLMEKKNAFFSEIDSVSQSMAPLKEEWMKTANSVPEEQRSAVNALLDKLAAVHKQVMEEENKCIAIAESSKSAIAGELNKIVNAKKAVSAYTSMKKQKP